MLVARCDVDRREKEFPGLSRRAAAMGTRDALGWAARPCCPRVQGAAFQGAVVDFIARQSTRRALPAIKGIDARPVGSISANGHSGAIPRHSVSHDRESAAASWT